MTQDERKELLTNIMNNMRDAMLAKADEWDESWDGIELRLLVAKVAEWESPKARLGGRNSRVRNFNNAWTVKNLY